MKKLSIKIMIFLLPLALAYLYIDHRLSILPNSYNLKRKYLEEQLNDIQVLQLGTSQTLYGVNPKYFSYYGFNLSNVNQSYYYDTRLALKYINKTPSLKVIIISSSYFSFRFQLINLERWREDFYYTFWDIDDPKLPYFRVEKYSKFFLYKLPTVKNFIYKHFKINLAPDLAYNGFQKRDSAGKYNEINDANGRYWVSLHDSLMNKMAIKDNLESLKKLLDAAKARNIKVVFITTPVFSTYSKFVNPKIIAENDSLLNELWVSYKIKYFNYFTDSRFNIDDFADNFHLSYVGAEKFSKIIDSEILKPAMGKFN